MCAMEYLPLTSPQILSQHGDMIQGVIEFVRRLINSGSRALTAGYIYGPAMGLVALSYLLWA